MSNLKPEKLPEDLGWEIKVCARGHLDFLIKDCFENMEVTDNDDGTTEIEGFMSDLPEVYGFIIRLRDAVIYLQSLQVTKMEIEITGKQRI